jgi:hypothetical protein
MTKDEVIARIKLVHNCILAQRILVSDIETAINKANAGLETGHVVVTSENTSSYRDDTVMYPRGQPFFELDGDIFDIVNVKDILGVIDDQE